MTDTISTTTTTEMGLDGSLPGPGHHLNQCLHDHRGPPQVVPHRRWRDQE